MVGVYSLFLSHRQGVLVKDFGRSGTQPLPDGGKRNLKGYIFAVFTVHESFLKYIIRGN